MRAILLLSCVVLLAGCNRELPLPGSDEAGKIVLIGELVADDSFSIRAGGSAPIAAGSRLSAPEGLTLTVTDNDGASWTVAGMEDELSSELHTVALKVPVEVRSGRRYDLVAKHDKLGEASASVLIPQPFSADVTDTVRAARGGTQVLRIGIQINDGPGDNYYVVEAVKQQMDVRREFFYNGLWREVRYYRYHYDSLKAVGATFPERADTTLGTRHKRLSIYTTDPATENLQNGNNAPVAFRRVLLSDRSFAGASYTTNVEIDSWPFVAETPTDRGRVLIQVKSVTKEYFDFLASYERQAPSAAGDNSSLKGNVIGGFGAVGGVVKKEWMYVFDEWE